MVIETLYSQEMAQWYDELYCDQKSTSVQIKFLTSLFKKYQVKSVLDVACGTGRHAIALKKLGYQVTGIDLEPAMVTYAKKKASEQQLAIDFKVQDMRNLKVKGSFDAAIIFFTAFSYLDSNEDVIQALTAIHKHLKKGGILIIENIFGWPNIIGGKFKKQLIETNHRKIGKDTKYCQVKNYNTLDGINNYMYNHATYQRKINGRSLATVKDSKSVKLRLYFPNELDLFFKLTGFKTLDFYGDIKGNKLSEKHHARLIAVAQK